MKVLNMQSIKCDNCQKELITNSSYPHNFNFQLSVIDTNVNTSGIQFAINMLPPFHGDKHFCSVNCINENLNRKFEKSEYEIKFSTDKNTTYMMNYRGYSIYRYINLSDDPKYTFWASSESSDYYSGISSLDECLKTIENIKRN